MLSRDNGIAGGCDRIVESGDRLGLVELWGDRGAMETKLLYPDTRCQFKSSPINW